MRSGPRGQCRKRGNNSSVHVGVCVDAIWFIERGESHVYKKSSSLASGLRDWSCGIGFAKRHILGRNSGGFQELISRRFRQRLSEEI